VRDQEILDLLVVGGGPAGLATAIEAALQGMTVAVIEQRSGVIDKACGEGLMPPAVRHLREMGVQLPRGRPFGGIRYLANGRAAEARFPDGHGLGIRRTLLQEALATRATELGVVKLVGRVTEIRQAADFVEAFDLRSRWLAAADGLHSAIRRSLELEKPPHQALRRHGIRRHFRTVPWSELVEVHWSEHAEAYVTPVDDDLVGVAILFAGHGSFDAWLECFPTITARLGPPVDVPKGAGPFGRRASKRVMGRVALVGDAAGFLDPLTGEGVGLGIAAARALVRCLVSGDGIDAYERAWWRITRRYWLITELLLRIRHVPALRRRLVPLLEQCPSLFESSLRMLIG